MRNKIPEEKPLSRQKVIGIINILILNVIAWLVFSYFWGGWNFRAFKPWRWIEMHKQDLINKRVARLESSTKDKVRVHQTWLAVTQMNERMTEGDVVFVGAEEPGYIELVQSECPERTIWVFDTFEAKHYEFSKESCDGSVSGRSVDIASPGSAAQIESIANNVKSVAGDMKESLANWSSANADKKIAFAWVDTIESDTLQSALSMIYDKLAAGGVLLIHDYKHQWEHVEQIVNQFVMGIVEEPVVMPDMYGTVCIVKNKTVAKC